MAMTIRPTSTIGAIGLQATNTIGYIVFESWHHLMDFMIKGLKLESKLALKLSAPFHK